jgi:hypothetical protein
MPGSQSLAKLPCPIHDDDSGRRRAENSYVVFVAHLPTCRANCLELMHLPAMKCR